MSSGFVSGGTVDAPIERSDEWLAAQRELEANRARKAAESQQSDGRSLYETLQANQAAKQEAFEEANRLKNQFRSLDEDEIEFLDSVLESTRAEEERVRRETAEGLEVFRRQQEEADKKARRGSDGAQSIDEGSPAREEEQWLASVRKRKRAKEKEVLKGVKIRRSSTTGKEPDLVPPMAKPPGPSSVKKQSEATTPTKGVQEEMKHRSPTPVAAVKSIPQKSGLVDYGSDEENDW